jgi:hypothetical protein
MADLEKIARQLKLGIISGNDLKVKVETNEISKGDRRKVAKMVERWTKQESLTPRQKQRLAVKEKKKLPKLTREDRRQKFQKDLDREREQEQANFTICLGCRKRGHFVKDCPKRQMAEIQQDQCSQICFNCGSFDHTLKNCPLPRDRNGQLPFAKCFICKQSGHISRDCPENANGLYPKGGCCHICFQKTHLAKDCPDKKPELADDRVTPSHKDGEPEKTREDGVRMKGLSVTEGVSLGDDAIIDDGDCGAEEEGSDDEERKKKSKKSKKRKRD